MTVVAITLGDPAGIGPEIALKAVKACQPRFESRAVRLLLVGCAEALDAAAVAVGGIPLSRVTAPDAFTHGAAVLALGADLPLPALGHISAPGGEHAFRAIECAVSLAMAGAVQAIVTAPLNKEALHLAGHNYSGHTEMLADMTGVKGSVMMLAHGAFRVSHVTTHAALQDVPGLVTPARLRRVIDLTIDALRCLGLEAPRVAVAALNPHAGEGGIFGRQDIDVVAPVVEAYRLRGLRIDGPVPGDTVFVKLHGGRYDAVIAMYHDQGHIPVKLLGFHTNPETGEWDALSGVNVTLGLPIIRTSVDHGTAFDIAGKGIANATSMIEAIDYALLLAGRRKGDSGTGVGTTCKSKTV